MPVSTSSSWGRKVALVLQGVVGQHHLGEIHGVPFAAKVQQGDEPLVEEEALFDVGVDTSRTAGCALA